MKLGEIQTLVIQKKVAFGVYLAENVRDTEHILLPGKQVPPEAEIGDEIRVATAPQEGCRPA